MNMRPITLFAWLAVAGAVIAWGAFSMFALNIMSQESAIRSHATDAEAITARESTALRLHALARDTKNERDRLDSLASAEVLEIADIIEGVGESAGVKVKIGGAVPEISSQQSAGGAPSLSAIGFQVEAEGAFPAVMHAAMLFENLPVLSSVQSLELTRAQGGEVSSKTKIQLWRLSARIQVMPTADISS